MRVTDTIRRLKKELEIERGLMDHMVRRKLELQGRHVRPEGLAIKHRFISRLLRDMRECDARIGLIEAQIEGLEGVDAGAE